MRLFEFDNGMILNLDAIESISKPITNDLQSYGGTYTITMTSGEKHTAYEWVIGNAPTFGSIIMKRYELYNIINREVSK